VEDTYGFIPKKFFDRTRSSLTRKKLKIDGRIRNLPDHKDMIQNNNEKGENCWSNPITQYIIC